MRQKEVSENLCLFKKPKFVGLDQTQETQLGHLANKTELKPTELNKFTNGVYLAKQCVE